MGGRYREARLLPKRAPSRSYGDRYFSSALFGISPGAALVVHQSGVSRTTPARMPTAAVAHAAARIAAHRLGRQPACYFAAYVHNSYVEKATVSKLKNNLSAYLRKVRSGQPVVIYDRDVPIARIERIETSGRGIDRLALLAAQGITRPAARPLSARELRTFLPLPRSARLLDALLEERAQER